MRLLLGVAKILYKILDIKEDDIPIVLTKEDTHFNVNPKEAILYLNVDFPHIEEVFQLSRIVYIIHTHLEGRLKDDILSKDNLDEESDFQSKIEQEATAFAQLFTSVTCDVILENKENYYVRKIRGSLFKPYDISTHHYNKELELKIQKGLNDAYERIKETYYSKMLELKKDVKSIFY